VRSSFLTTRTNEDAHERDRIARLKGLVNQRDQNARATRGALFRHVRRAIAERTALSLGSTGASGRSTRLSKGTATARLSVAQAGYCFSV
jgi:hypothetical protein